MISVASPEQSAAALSSLKKHAIAPRIRGTIGDTVLNNMDVNARSQRRSRRHKHGLLDNLVNGKIRTGRMSAVEQGGGNPDFVGNLEDGFNQRRHNSSKQCK